MRIAFAFGHRRCQEWLRWIVISLAMMLAGGCKTLDGIFEPEPLFLVVNACRGSTIDIVDGKNRMVLAGLQFGETKPVPVRGSGGDRVVLTAKAFSLADGRPLGNTSTEFSIPEYYWRDSRGNSQTSRDRRAQMEPWEIDRLDVYFDREYSCEGR